MSSPNTPKMPSSAVAPASNRIATLDVMRGFAIFGIFVVNIEIMNSVFMNQDAFNAQWSGGLNQLANRLRQLFFYTKFFPVFSFLFGLGIAMQALKAIDSGTGYNRGFFLRRMALLFLFGGLHILLFWGGDVIHLYALLGLCTAALLRLNHRWLLGLSVLLLVFPYYDWIFEGLYNLIGFEPHTLLSEYNSKQVTELLRDGSYSDGMIFRLREYLANLPMLVNFFAPVALSMFLLGLFVGKKKWVYDIGAVAHRYRKPVLIVAIVSNAYRLFFLFVVLDAGWHRNPDFGFLFGKVMVICDVLMGLFYLWLLAWLMRYDRVQKWLKPLTYVGRMALTNYIGQSVIGLWLFSAWGLGWYETLAPWQTLVTAMVVFALQVIFSYFWLRFFKYGPLEWLWRCGSYLRWWPIVK